jgi:predicted nucleic acid-binding protein
MKRVLVDTSVWIEHLKSPQTILINHLRNRLVLNHSAVIGELACGELESRLFLSDLKTLPYVTEASPEEVLELIERRRLYQLHHST